MTESTNHTPDSAISRTLQAIAAGSESDFARLFKTAYPKVLTFCVGFLKNNDDAEDVAQSVFIRLWSHRELLATVQNLDGYLFMTAKRQVLNFIQGRVESLIPETAARTMQSKDSSPEQDAEAEDLRLLVELIVSDMPPQRQRIYRMSREQGLTVPEIAQQLNLAPKTVENHLTLALRTLRQSILIYLLLLAWG